jgi:UDP-N-acetylmuramate--alanine ligase
MTDIYAAGEKEIEGIDSKNLCDGIRDSGHKDVVYIPERQAVVEHLLKTLKSRDMVITMGAGDIWKVGDDLIDELKDHEEGKFASDRHSS